MATQREVIGLVASDTWRTKSQSDGCPKRQEFPHSHGKVMAKSSHLCARSATPLLSSSSQHPGAKINMINAFRKIIGFLRCGCNNVIRHPVIQVVVTLSEANCHRFSDLEGPDVAKTEQKAEWPETPEVAMEPF